MIKYLLLFLLIYCSYEKSESKSKKQKIENKCFVEREGWEIDTADFVSDYARIYLDRETGSELTMYWENNTDIIYINNAWTKYWNFELEEIFLRDSNKRLSVTPKYRGKTVLKEGDLIFKINDCKIEDMLEFGDGTVNHWPYYDQGYIPLTYVVLLYSTEHSKKFITEIEIKRNGKRMKIKNK